MEFKHTSVLLDESIEGLCIDKDGIYIDGTLGGGGHSMVIAEKLDSGKLICIDRDLDAIGFAKERLQRYSDRIIFVHDTFNNVTEILKDLGIDRVNGILLDLGVSSYQIDTAWRGFSYMIDDAPLDMRMDRSDGFSAADILNSYDEKELVRIFREYGEEKFASKIAKSIVLKRDERPFETTKQLNDIIMSCVPQNVTKGHPSKRVFQALRIEVNREIEPLKDTINDMIEVLDDKGRLCVISFHSLEDRIIKNAFRDAMNPCTCPKNFPVCVCGKKPKGLVITRKPLLPTEKEQSINARSRSAKLRIFERQL